MLQVSLALPSLRFKLLPLLDRFLPSLPTTLRDMGVPPLFRERYILTGYRPLALPWRCYALSLLQIHNETLNVWSHLLAAICVLARFLLFTVLQGGGIIGFRHLGPEGQGFSFDASSLPLLLFILSALTYLSCSTVARLLHSRSEEAHYFLFFLSYVSVAVYQYGSTLALYVYSSDISWTQSVLGQVFLPASALLAWLICVTSCNAKVSYQRSHLLYRKLCRIALVGVAYLLAFSPVAHRLAVHTWSSISAWQLHLLQMALFLLAALFFSCPVPEVLSPGRYDIIGNARQICHVLLALSVLVQQEAVQRDFLLRRPALLRAFGEERLLLICTSFLCLTFGSAVVALGAGWRVAATSMKEQI